MSMKKRAFTLGEVLIALSVVGLVALLTVPSLVADIAGKQRMVKLQNTIGDLNNAIQLYMMKKHVNNLEGSELNTAYKMQDAIAELVRGEIKTGLPIYTYSPMKSGSSGIPNYFGASNKTLVLENGAYVRFFGDPDDEKYAIYIDVNGQDKPNIGGLDYFGVYVYRENVYGSEGELLARAGDIGAAYQNENESRVTLMNNCKTTNIFYCYYWAMKKGYDHEYYNDELQ